jgi:NAD(P)-dependent dehydrogenase (short-subunit alcohol dehydrogenase family)
LEPEVRVNAICPSYISDAGMAWSGWELKCNQEGGSVGSIGEKFALDNILLERLQKAEDIARADVFLASTDAKEITGAALNVGGGVVMD